MVSTTIISLMRDLLLPVYTNALTIPHWNGPLFCPDPPQWMSLDPPGHLDFPELSFLNPHPGHPLEYDPSSGCLGGEI